MIEQPIHPRILNRMEKTLHDKQENLDAQTRAAIPAIRKAIEKVRRAAFALDPALLEAFIKQAESTIGALNAFDPRRPRDPMFWRFLDGRIRALADILSEISPGNAYRANQPHRHPPAGPG